MAKTVHHCYTKIVQPELENYIKENLAKGIPKDQIRQALIQKGWETSDIDAAFSQIATPLSLPLSSLPPFPLNQTPKNVPQESKTKIPVPKLTANKKIFKLAILSISIALFLLLIFSFIFPEKFIQIGTKIWSLTPSGSTITKRDQLINEGWKRYTYKPVYTIYYPPDWELNPFGTSPDATALATLTPKGSYPAQADTPRINIYANINFAIPDYCAGANCKKENVSLDGEKATKITTPGNQVNYQFQKKNLVISIDAKGEEKITKKIIETFTWIKEDSKNQP